MPNQTLAAHYKPTVTVSDHGEIAASSLRGSFRQGFADLLDFASPRVEVAVLPPGAPTALGFVRTGQALRGAMAAFRKANP